MSCEIRFQKNGIKTEGTFENSFEYYDISIFRSREANNGSQPPCEWRLSHSGRFGVLLGGFWGHDFLCQVNFILFFLDESVLHSFR